MKLTRQELEYILKRNPSITTEADSQDSGQSPKLERPAVQKLVRRKKDKNSGARQVQIQVTDVRKRLSDDDNLCEKFIIDCLRRDGTIFDDSPKHARIFTTQRKCTNREDPHTLIEIF